MLKTSFPRAMLQNNRVTNLQEVYFFSKLITRGVPCPLVRIIMLDQNTNYLCDVRKIVLMLF